VSLVRRRPRHRRQFATIAHTAEILNSESRI